MSLDPLATPCLLYCGSCRYYITERCKGCGKMNTPKGVGYTGCPILRCCRTERKLRYCVECNQFPCPVLKQAKTIHPDWQEDQARLPLKK